MLTGKEISRLEQNKFFFKIFDLLRRAIKREYHIVSKTDFQEKDFEPSGRSLLPDSKTKPFLLWHSNWKRKCYLERKDSFEAQNCDLKTFINVATFVWFGIIVLVTISQENCQNFANIFHPSSELWDHFKPEWIIFARTCHKQLETWLIWLWFKQGFI